MQQRGEIATDPSGRVVCTLHADGIQSVANATATARPNANPYATLYACAFCGAAGWIGDGEV